MSNRSGLCDVAQKEFVRQLAEMGLKIREIQGDGNCLFRALGDQMEGNSQNHAYYRKETADYMMSHRRDFEPFLEDNCSFEDYVCKLQRDGTYAGNDAIVAFARRFDVNVIIHQVCAPLWIIEGGCCHAPELHIAYYNGDHYASVRKFGDDSSSPARVWLRDLKKYRKDRRNQRPTDAEIQRMVQHIMNVTECIDAGLIRNFLEQNNFDIDQTIVNMTEQNPCKIDAEKQIQDECVPLYPTDAEKKRMERRERKNKRDEPASRQRNDYNCGATTPAECDILNDSARRRYEGGTTDEQATARRGIRKEKGRTGSSSPGRRNRDFGSLLSDESEGPPAEDCAVPVYTFRQPPRQDCRQPSLRNEATIQGNYSDSSGGGPNRESPRYKERGETATTPKSNRRNLPSPKSPRSRASSKSSCTNESKSPRATRRSFSKSPKSSKRNSSKSPKPPRSNFSKSPRCSFSVSPKPSKSEFPRSPEPARDRVSRSSKSPKTDRISFSSRETTPRSRPPSTSVTPKSPRKFDDDLEECRYPGVEDDIQVVEQTSSQVIQDRSYEAEEVAPVAAQAPSDEETTYTKERFDAIDTTASGLPQCPLKNRCNRNLPIVCKTLSDAVISTASSTSQDYIDKAQCILRSRKSSETWLNITLGILVAFLVLCLIRLF